MSKLSAEAFVILKEFVDSGKIVQLEKRFNGYEVTIFDNHGPQSPHSHYNGEELTDIVINIKD